MSCIHAKRQEGIILCYCFRWDSFNIHIVIDEQKKKQIRTELKKAKQKQNVALIAI